MKTVLFNQRFLLLPAAISYFLLSSASWAIVLPFMPTFPISGGQYNSINRTGYGSVQVEIIGMSLTSHDTHAVALPSPEQTFRADSFFDIFTELSLYGGDNYNIDGFFDVFIELSITGRGDGTGGFNTEILSMSLTCGPLGILIRESPSRPTYGHVTVLKLADNTYQVDSLTYGPKSALMERIGYPQTILSIRN